jgi:hypothetical protein
MPHEIRHIIFSNEEVARALVDYHRRSGNPLPTGSVLRCSPELQDGHVTAALHMTVDQDGSRLAVPVTSNALAAALILFCINQRIPLPTKAAKSLQMVGEQVGLVITKTDDRPGRR